MPVELIEALRVAATNPLAYGGYVVLLAAWLVWSWRVTRLRVLAKRLKDLPEADRRPVLEAEIGPVPMDITAEEWLRARQQNFDLLRRVIVAITLVLILSLSAFTYLEYLGATDTVVVAGQATLNDHPLVRATLTVVGVSGEWVTDRNGAFRAEFPNNRGLDSIHLVLTYEADFDTVSFDTTVATTTATALHITLETEQTQIIHGTVMEVGTSTPIAGAQIEVLGNRGSGTTDAQGRFEFLVQGHLLDEIVITVNDPEYHSVREDRAISESALRIVMRRNQ